MRQIQLPPPIYGGRAKGILPPPILGNMKAIGAPPILGGLTSPKTIVNQEEEKSKEQKEKDLTVKQRKWLKAYIKGGNATQAVIDAGYDVKDRDSASVIGSENLGKLNFVDFLEEMGITDKKLVDALDEGLGATKPIGALILLDKDGNTISKENEGQIEVADYAIRHKYVESILKLKGKFKTADVQVLSQNNFRTTYNEWNQPTPILGENSIEFVSFKEYKEKTNEELHKDIQDIQKILKERHDLKLEDHTEEQLDELIHFDKEDETVIEVTPVEKPQSQEAKIIENPQQPVLDKLDTIKRDEDPQVIIDRKKQAGQQVKPMQEDTYLQPQAEPFDKLGNDTFRIGQD